MKRTILKFIAFLLIFAGSFSSCDKKEDILLKGETYTVVSPFKGGIKINFLDQETLVILKEKNDSSWNYVEHKYKIHGNKIKLMSNDSGYGIITTEHYFRVINRNKFEIGYLGMYIPEEYPGNMIFEKE